MAESKAEPPEEEDVRSTHSEDVRASETTATEPASETIDMEEPTESTSSSSSGPPRDREATIRNFLRSIIRIRQHGQEEVNREREGHRSLSAWKTRWWREHEERERRIRRKKAKISHGHDSDVRLAGETRSYTGHRNIRTVKEVNFYGPRSNFVISGSDDGRIYIWRKSDGKLVQCMEGDSMVVNCVQPNPVYGAVTLATSGIDNDVKIWAPTGNEANALDDLDRIIRENEERAREPEPIRISVQMLFAFLSRLERSD